MQVIKRNGNHEMFDFKKVKKVIEHACGEEALAEQFISKLHIQLKDGMSSKDVQKSLIQLAVEMVSPTETYWDGIATKLFTYELIKEAGINREQKKFGYPNFYKLIKTLTNQGLYHTDVLKEYKKTEIDELGAYIKPERDELLSYVGLYTLAERYLIRGFNKEVFELPQEMFMGVALFLALAEEKESRVGWAKKFYDELSSLNGIVATPTMSNARKPHNQLSSCFIGTMDDSLESIFHVNTSFSQVSKFGGGMGIYAGKVRAANSDIRGFKNTSGGTIPWIRIINDTAIATDQLGVRKGAVSVTLDIWHRDIFSFLQLKTNNGDERLKAHDIFPAVSIPDVYMKQLKDKGDFYLFDPHEINTYMGYNLEDSWGEEFEHKYWQCVNHPLLPKQKVKAMALLAPILKSATETGNPFLFFRDTVNRMNPNKHAGMIYSSNLCMEIAQNMKSQGEVNRKTITDKQGNTFIVETREAGDFVVCNLASINLGRVHTKEQMAKTVPVFMRMIDNVIDLNFYPVEEARHTNKRYRSLGLGTYGYHEMLATNAVRWESDNHLEFVDDVYEILNYHAVKSSMENAIEKGAYALFKGSDWDTGEYFELRDYTTGLKVGKTITTQEWIKLAKNVHKNGVRNAYMLAVAPNGSSSLYGGSTQSIDPIFSTFYFDEKKGQVIPVVAPQLSPKTAFFYIPAHQIDQTWSIKANAVRQRHIDQSQSFNIYINPEEEKLGAKIAKMYMTAWQDGVKTIYYTRSLSVDVEDCASCSV